MLECIAQPADKITLAKMGPPGAVIQLPGGILDGSGGCFRKLTLRELTGRDEEVLLSQAFASAGEQVTEFLRGAIAGIDGYEQEIGSELINSMLVGDRDYLLLRLRQINIDDHVHQVLRCPHTDCGNKVDVDFDISEIPLVIAGDTAAEYELALQREVYPDDPDSNHLSLRFPTGGDLIEVTKLSAGQPARANSILFSRIIKRIGGKRQLAPDEAHVLPLWLRGMVTDYLEQYAPGPDLRIDIPCPYCRRDMSYSFDIQGFFLPSGK